MQKSKKLLFVILFFVTQVNAQINRPDSLLKNKLYDTKWLKSRIDDYNNIPQHDNNDFTVIYNRAHKNMENGNYQSAIEGFRKADFLYKQLNITDKPRTATHTFNYPLFYVGVCKELLNEMDSAMVIFTALVTEDPTFYEAFNEMGLINLKQNEPYKAIESFKTSMNLNSSFELPCFNIGLTYYFLNDLDGARKYAEKAIDINSNMERAYLLAGSIYYIQGLKSKAEKSYIKATQINTNSYGYFALGVIYYQSGDLKKALPNIRQYMLSDTSNIVALTLEGDILIKMDSVKAGIESLYKAFVVFKDDAEASKLNLVQREMYNTIGLIKNGNCTPDVEEIILNLFKAYYLEGVNSLSKVRKSFKEKAGCRLCERLYFLVLYHSGHSEEFLRGIDKFLADETSATNFQLMKAEYLYSSGNYEACIKAINKAIENGADQDVAYFNLGVCYAAAKQLDDAEISFTHAIKLNGNYFAAYVNRAELFARMEEPEKAAEDYRSALKIDPGNLMVLIDLADLFVDLENGDSAILYYNQANTVMHRRTDVYAGRAEARILNLDYENARLDLDTSLLINPYDQKSLRVHARLCVIQHNYKDAMRDYNTLIKGSPDFAYYYALRGDLHEEMKEYEKAISDYKKAAKYDSEYSYVLRQTGKMYLLLNDTVNSNKYYEMTMVPKPVTKEDYMVNARTLSQMNRYEEALVACKEALLLDSLYTSALGSMGWYYYCLDDFEKCIFYSEKAVKTDSSAFYAMFNIALSYLRLGKTNEAKQLYAMYTKTNLQQKKKISDGVFEDLENLIKKNILVEESRFIIDNILKRP